MTTYDESRADAATAPAAHVPAQPGRAPSPAGSRSDLSPAHRRSWTRRHRAAVAFASSDLLALAVTTVVAGTVTWTVGLLAVLLLVTIGTGGYYRSRFTLSALDDAPHLVGRALVAGAITALIAAALAAPFPLASAPLVVVFAAALVALRAIAYAVVRTLRRSRRITSRTLILGAGMVGQDLALTLTSNGEYGLEVVGFVDDAPLVTGPASAAPVLGGTADLARILDDEAIDQLVIAFAATTGEAMVDIVRTADRLDAEISVVPRLFELAVRGRDSDEINGLPLERLRRAPFRSMTWPLKRVLDVLLAGTALVVLSPLLGVIALVLRLTDGHGVIFRQERVGLDGRPFELLKFRSMRPADEDESSTRWNIKDDDRMGRLGRLIRRTSIDELPQLWNIVRGDMSLVGPRPERPYFVQTFDDAFPRYGARHRVPCGLTGWAQIHGLRGDTSIEERARFDNYYIENWSLWLDIKIILRTIGSLMRGSG